MRPIIGIPAVLALVYRAYSRKSLTPFGIVVAAVIGALHAAHPSPAPFALLVVFFLGGTRVTKVKHDIKARLTVSSLGGGSGGEGPRTHVQVLANAGVAGILVLIDLWRQWREGGQACLGHGGGLGALLLAGITANYAAVAADTYSSELGILAKSAPRLITSPLRKVPPGTNGGVTIEGIAAGALGAFTIAMASIFTLPFCDGWTWQHKALWILGVVACGTTGSLLDSVLGALLQSTVVDKRTGKVVEAAGGIKVLVHPGSVTTTPLGDIPLRGGSQIHTVEDIANAITPKQTRIELERPVVVVKKEGDDHESRKVISGSNILDNNDVNFLMAALTTGFGMLVASRVF